VSEFAQRLASVVTRFERDAADVDEAPFVPRGHFDDLAELGLYGVFAPVEYGGLGFGVNELCESVELLASGCLASTFVWIQHLRLLGAMLDPATPDHLRERFVDVVTGATRGGVALAGLLPGPTRLRATPVDGGWMLDGHAPWVSGWGLVDTLVVTARAPEETVVTCLLPASAQDGLSATRWDLSALNASATVRLDFAELFVDEEFVVGRVPFDPGAERPEGLRVNGSLALGLARRCCALRGPSPLDEELDRRRAALELGDATSMAVARAAASEFAVRAAHALAVHRGSSSVLKGDVAERCQREAALLLTFGSRPAIRDALLGALGAS
jgi:alkylation response protein AidB-like acyl-CoA dehydrogenase